MVVVDTAIGAAGAVVVLASLLHCRGVPRWPLSIGVIVGYLLSLGGHFQPRRYVARGLSR